MIQINNLKGFLDHYLIADKLNISDLEVSLSATNTEIDKNVGDLMGSSKELKKYFKDLLELLDVKRTEINKTNLSQKSIRIKQLEKIINKVKKLIKLHTNSDDKKLSLKWKGSPALLGAFINELIDGQYIETPMYNGETNYSQIARICNKFFEVDTTLANLIKEINPVSNSLSKTKKEKIKLPERTDLD